MCQQIMKDPAYRKRVEPLTPASTEQAEAHPPRPCTYTPYLSASAYVLDMPVLEAHIFLLLGID